MVGPGGVMDASPVVTDWQTESLSSGWAPLVATGLYDLEVKKEVFV